jgi:uncharacterized BrkB/YihY/UPF0761 family membrane protein
MENNLGLFIKKGNRKLTFAVLLFLIFFALSIVSLYRGVQNRETWRILTASAGALICIVLCSVTVSAVIKSGKKVESVEPTKPLKRKR